MRKISGITLTAAICLLVIVLAVASVWRQKSIAQQREVSAAEYDVFSAYITSKFAPQHGAGPETSVILLNMTQSDELETFSDANGNTQPWVESKSAARGCAPT